MNDRELLKSLNGIQFSEDDIEECFNYEGVSIDDLKFKSANLRTKLSQDCFEEQKREVKGLLEKDEQLLTYIKGASIELLRMGVLLNGTSPLGMLKTDDIGFNYAFFVTNKRILVADTNYYDKQLHKFKEIPLEDISDIQLNKYGYTVPKKVRKASKSIIHHTTFANSFLYYFYFAGTWASFVALNAAFSSLLSMFFESYSNFETLEAYKDGFSSALAFFVIGVFYLLVRHYTKFKLRVSITTKDNKYYDFIIVNRDYRYVLSVLKKIKNNLKQ